MRIKKLKRVLSFIVNGELLSGEGCCRFFYDFGSVLGMQVLVDNGSHEVVRLTMIV